VAVSKEGFKFDPRSDSWSSESLAKGSKNIEFYFLSGSDGIKVKFKMALMQFLESHSFSHAINIYQRFKAFYLDIIKEKSEDIVEICLADVLNYRASLDKGTLWKLGVVRILLFDMRAMGFGIASEEAIDYLRDSKSQAIPREPRSERETGRLVHLPTRNCCTSNPL
jgi:hypothetical protein